MDMRSNVIRFLATLPCFGGLDDATIKRIAPRCRTMSRLVGETLFTERDPCRDLYVLAAGRVKCYRASPEGREQILKIFEQPGDMFCTTSAFSTGAHIVSAEAMIGKGSGYSYAEGFDHIVVPG